jgi:hypothetical protein
MQVKWAGKYEENLIREPLEGPRKIQDSVGSEFAVTLAAIGIISPF